MMTDWNVEEDKDSIKPAILNLASRRKPGGGYDRGRSMRHWADVRA